MPKWVVHFSKSDQRFSTSGRPDTPVACYLTSGLQSRLHKPGPDLHRLADDDFSGHTSEGLARPLLQTEVDINESLFRAEWRDMRFMHTVDQAELVA